MRLADLFDRCFHEYTNTKKTSNKQHVVPQMLLKRFSVGQPHCINCLFVLNKQSNTVSNRPHSIAKELGSITDLYDARDKTGKHSNYIDQKIYRERLESNAARLLDEFEQKLATGLTYFEDIVLNNFMAHQITRTVFFRQCVEAYVYILIEDKIISTEFLNNKQLPSSIASNSFQLDLNRLLLCKHYAKPSIKEGPRAKGMLTHICLHMSDSIARSLWGKKIKLIKTPDDEVLISDNPIIPFDFNVGVTGFIEWWNLRHKNILFPISHNKLLVMSTDRPKIVIDDDWEQCKSFVELSNYGQFVTASNEVYSRNCDVLHRYRSYFSKNTESWHKT